MSPTTTRTGRGHLVVRVLLRTTGVVLLLVTAASVVALLIVPKVKGAIPLTVQTSSMEPTLRVNSIAVVGPVQTSDIVVGDIITFQREPGKPELVTHRVIGLSYGVDGDVAFVTQGDNNPDRDAGLVVADSVQGRVLYSVPLVGHVTSVLDGHRELAVNGLGGLLIAYGAFSVLDGIRRSRATAAADNDPGAGEDPSPEHRQEAA